jgi:hypothetical protein
MCVPEPPTLSTSPPLSVVCRPPPPTVVPKEKSCWPPPPPLPVHSVVAASHPNRPPLPPTPHEISPQSSNRRLSPPAMQMSSLSLLQSFTFASAVCVVYRFHVNYSSVSPSALVSISYLYLHVSMLPSALQI